MKYPYTTIDITIASQVPGQVFDVVLSVGRSFLLMISVGLFPANFQSTTCCGLAGDFFFCSKRSHGNPFFELRASGTVRSGKTARGREHRTARRSAVELQEFFHYRFA